MTKRPRNIPPRSEVAPDDPLLLSVAAALAFPDGSMGASGLRREAARGNLVVERIAGKLFTTLAEIGLMRERCRVPARRPVPPPRSAAPNPISDEEMKRAYDNALAIVEQLGQTGENRKRSVRERKGRGGPKGPC